MRIQDVFWDTERLVAERPTFPLIVGFGTTATRDGPAPLAVVLSSRPHNFVDAAGSTLESSTFDAYLKGLRNLSDSADQWPELVDSLGNHGTTSIEPLILEVSTIEPLAAVGTGDRIRCVTTHTRGSLGFPVDMGRGAPDGFLTAGHVTPQGVNSVVELESPHRFGQATYVPIGTVEHHSDPIGAAGIGGWDFAVVRSDLGSTPPPLTTSVASLPALVSNPRPVTLHGAISGVQQGGIVGSLQALGLPGAGIASTTRLWRDCWIMIPSGVAQQGDSGAAVTDATSGDAIGTLVGGSRQLPNTTFAVQYVQDLENLLADRLTALGVGVI